MTVLPLDFSRHRPQQEKHSPELHRAMTDWDTTDWDAAPFGVHSSLIKSQVITLL